MFNAASGELERAPGHALGQYDIVAPQLHHKSIRKRARADITVLGNQIAQRYPHHIHMGGQVLVKRLHRSVVHFIFVVDELREGIHLQLDLGALPVLGKAHASKDHEDADRDQHDGHDDQRAYRSFMNGLFPCLFHRMPPFNRESFQAIANRRV